MGRLVVAQSFDEWADHVNWDGTSHWSEYLIFSPKFTGPNAMPVPLSSTGRVENRSFISLGTQYQGLSGDQTFNFTFYAGHTFLKDRIAIDVFMVPFETFKLSEERKLERNVYWEHWNQNTAIGDLYINTVVQVLSESRNDLDLAVRIGLKTASSGLDNPARFIDSPGYYLDLSSGKTFSSNRFDIRPYVMLGFFAWQTNDESLRQNDAFMYGVGHEVALDKWIIEQSFRGYSGYHNIGDKPMVFRNLIARKLLRHRIQLIYQAGIRDFLYQTIELSFQYVFKETN